MESLFIKYDQALELKQLEFDEPCFYVKVKDYPEHWYTPTDYDDFPEQKEKEVLIPTFSQSFKFFRDKYELYYTIEGSKKYGFAFFIYYENDDKDELKSKEYSTYEEAEQECIVKLIEIVKENK